MRCGTENDIGAEHNVVSDVDRSVIHERKVKVCVKTVTDMNELSAPVGVKWCFDIAAFSDGAEHFFQKFSFFLLLAGAQGIIVEKKIEMLCLLLYKVFVVTQIQFAAVHAAHGFGNVIQFHKRVLSADRSQKCCERADKARGSHDWGIRKYFPDYIIRKVWGQDKETQQ